ncbi:scabin-related ADP-ribosyltransferase [Duganella phyllosphaerae]
MIAGLNRDVSSDQDNSGALKKGWDARKMEQDVAHQVAITQAFSVAAAAEISRYADGKLAQSESLRERADKERDPEQRDALLLQAAAIDRDWSEGGKARMLANTAAGALGGGLMGLAGGAAGSAVSGALYHADVPSSMASLPLEQQARIQKMANDAGFNGLTSAADWEALKLVSDLRFDPASQNLPQAEVDGRIRNYLTRLGASPQQVDEVIKTFADAGLAAVGTPRTAIAEQILVGPTSAPTDIGAVDYTTTDKQGVFLGTKVIDKGTQGVGKVLTEVGKAVDSSPVAKFTLEALDFASGPVIYGVNQIPVVEDLKNHATGAFTGFFAEGFKEAGYDQPASNAGGVGGGAITMVGLGGFAAIIENAGKKLELFGGATNSPKGSNVFISEEPKHIIVGDEPFAGVSGLENGTISHPVKDSLAGRAEGISGANSTAAVNNAAATRKSGFIFRGDDRDPAVIFKEGFQPQGTNLDLYNHAASNRNSAYVSTSKSPNVVRAAPGVEEGGFVYTMRGQPNGVDVNATLGTRSPFRSELEIAVPGGINSSDIMGARAISPNGKFIGPFIKNPEYLP